jgi:CheY-like chemotaxis protein
VTVVSTNTHEHVVLLVEDYDDTREALAAELRGAHFDVRSAWAAEDGLPHLREGFRPCVALIDLRMPGMDGWTLWDRIRRDPDPTIASTSVVLVSGDPAEQRRARITGIREFLTKPVEADALIAAVERHCAQTARAGAHDRTGSA